MKKRIVSVLAVLIALVAVAPLSALAQTVGATGLPSSGIFGCNVNGAYSMSVGSMSASGTFVPVSDATVELNTGYLVYEECVLRNVVDRQREAVTSALANSQLTTIGSGRNGSAYFSQQPALEQQQVGATAFNTGLPTVVSGVTPVYQSDVQTALARNYSISVNAPQTALACPYAVNATTWSGQNSDFWGALQAAENPTCIEMSDYYLAQNQIYSQVAAAQNLWLTELNWGNGYYSVTNSAGVITTPGYAVANIANQAINTGFQQMQNANDVGQMVGSLFAGLSTQVLSMGLTGLLQSINGSPSYLSQVQTESNTELDQTLTGVGAQAIASALQTEEQYLQALDDIANDLTQGASQLQAAENSCWNSVVPAAQSGAQSSNISLNLSAIAQATSSLPFSNAIIALQITPLASSTASAIATSQQAIETLQTLLGQVEGGSQTSQQNALNQINALVSDGALHTTADVQNATQQEQNLQQTLSTEISDVDQVWTTGNPDLSNPYDANSGWCNTGNPETIPMWVEEWKAS